MSPYERAQRLNQRVAERAQFERMAAAQFAAQDLFDQDPERFGNLISNPARLGAFHDVVASTQDPLLRAQAADLSQMRLFAFGLLREQGFSPLDSLEGSNELAGQMFGQYQDVWNMGGGAVARARAEGFELASPAQKAAFAEAFAQGRSYDEAVGVAKLVAVREQVDALDARIADIAQGDPDKAAQLGRLKTVLTSALISKDVYFNRSIEQLLPQGVRRIEGREQLAAFNLTPEIMLNHDSGYFGALYAVGDDRYILANRGTDDGPMGPDYTKGNIPQNFGMRAEQYEEAIEIAQLVAKSEFGDRVSFTGHSLGGGLASAQALITGLPALTFNASGLHPRTVGGFDAGRANELIQAYYIPGELLGNAQDKVVVPVIVGGKVVGEIDPFPEAVGERAPIPAVTAPTWRSEGIRAGGLIPWYQIPFNQKLLHGIDSVVYSLHYELQRLSGVTR